MSAESVQSDPAAMPEPKIKLTLTERIELFFSGLGAKSAFWNRICSLIWLPYAFKSGIQMKRVDANTFTAVLPFRRINKNWYNAMAGAALLGNAEIAGGTYVFGIVGNGYTVVCKNLEYRFLRPCFGPAVYRIRPREPLEPLIETGTEFNITIDMRIVQAIAVGKKKDKKARAVVPESEQKERRVGRCSATFHVTPKKHHKAKRGSTIGEPKIKG